MIAKFGSPFEKSFLSPRKRKNFFHGHSALENRRQSISSLRSGIIEKPVSVLHHACPGMVEECHEDYGFLSQKLYQEKKLGHVYCTKHVKHH